MFGEDVARKGGVYNVTNGLQQDSAPARVFDTLLDETSILGIAQGAAHVGLLPMPEIQYLAYLHNALDQLRGEAASLQFFSQASSATPWSCASLASPTRRASAATSTTTTVGALRDIPGLVLAVPARGDDAARMLRGCVAMAAEDGRVVVFLEPIALYHEKDLYADGDGAWLTDYPPPPSYLLPGEPGVYEADASQRRGPADRQLRQRAAPLAPGPAPARRARTASARRVLDLRWLNPLPFVALRQHASRVPAVLVVDECRRTGGGVADAIVADLVEPAPAPRCPPSARSTPSCRSDPPPRPCWSACRTSWSGRWQPWASARR